MSKKYNPIIKDQQRYKTNPCLNFTIYGKCPYGPRCQYAHGPNDLRSTFSNNIKYNFNSSISINSHLKKTAIKCAEFVLK